MSTAVVYVHGLWMVGIEGTILRIRLARSLAARTPFFRYRSIAAPLEASAERLAEQLRALRVDSLHLVGHSLGGLVIHQMFEQGGGVDLPPGRVVMLGSPLGGSRAANSLALWPIGKAIMGRSVREALLSPVQRTWHERRELGIIAGNRSLGLGRIVNTHQGPSDGTIFVDETRIHGMKEHRVVPVSHTALPLSGGVARLTARFLAQGDFHAELPAYSTLY